MYVDFSLEVEASKYVLLMLVWVDFNRQLLKCLPSTNDIFHVLYVKNMCYFKKPYSSKNDSRSIQL